MCKKSIENLVQLLEQEEEAERRKRPKIIKLPDPTIFTITSPSQWQRNNLKSPDIAAPFIWPPVTPMSPLPSCPPQPSLQPPQEVPECEDFVNTLPRTAAKILDEPEYSELSWTLIIIPTKYESRREVVQFLDLPPQPPECQIEDSEWRPSFKLKHLAENMRTDPPCVSLMAPAQSDTNLEIRLDRCLSLSPPQPPPVEIEDATNNLNYIKKHFTDDVFDPDLQIFPPSLILESGQSSIELSLVTDLQRPEVDIVDTINNQTARQKTDRFVENEISNIVLFVPLNDSLEAGKIMIVGLSTDLQSPNVDVCDIANSPNSKQKIIEEKIRTVEIFYHFQAQPAHEIFNSDILNVSSTDLQIPDIFINDTTNFTEYKVKQLAESDDGTSVSCSIIIPTSQRSRQNQCMVGPSLPNILIRSIEILTLCIALTECPC